MTEQIREILQNWQWTYFAEKNPFLATALALTGVLILSYGIYQLIVFLLRNRMTRRSFGLFEILRKHCYNPGLLTVIAFGSVVLVPMLPLSREWLFVANRGLAIMQIVCVAWLCIRIITALSEYSLLIYNREGTGIANVQVRITRTRYKIFERLLIITIAVMAVIAILMTFDGFRQAGLSLLASAGVVSVIIGFAAQRSLGGILAGIQIAISQPIRIDDAVVVENEWGRVEEITLTFVVIRLWDDRRLIVPITYFIEKPFYNWTRSSDQLLGVVILQLDLMFDVTPLRAHFLTYVANHPKWDGREAKLHVVEIRDRVQEVRFLVSAANSGNLWDLRADIRENMLRWLAVNHPAALPRNRVESYPVTDGSPSAGQTRSDAPTTTLEAAEPTEPKHQT